MFALLVCVRSGAWLCPTLQDPKDCSLPGSPIHRIFQARILEWVAISFSRGSSQPRDQTRVSCLHLLHWQAGSSPLEPSGKPRWVLITVVSEYQSLFFQLYLKSIYIIQQVILVWAYAISQAMFWCLKYMNIQNRVRSSWSIHSSSRGWRDTGKKW